MEKWSILKAAVASSIRANGNQEITGELLQNVLTSIISSVGENATFAGIATTGTNPGAPDGPVFYLATEAGSYPNFNSITLTNGEAAILRWDGSTWHKETSGFATQQAIDKLMPILGQHQGDITGIKASLNSTVQIVLDNIAAIEAEKQRAIAAEQSNATAIEAEKQRAIVAEQSNAAAIEAEIQRAKETEQEIRDNDGVQNKMIFAHEGRLKAAEGSIKRLDPIIFNLEDRIVANDDELEDEKERTALLARDVVRLQAVLQSIQVKLSQIVAIEEQSFNVTDEEGNSVMRYSDEGFDVAELSEHFQTLIKNIEDIGLKIGVTEGTAYDGKSGSELAALVENTIKPLIDNLSKDMALYKEGADNLKVSDAKQEAILQSILSRLAVIPSVLEDGVFFTDEEGYITAKITKEETSGFGGDIEYERESDSYYDI